jgi:hypothetical protein
MKVISITFAPLIQKLWNNKHAHHLVKHTSNQKWSDGYMVWESFNMIISKQTNISKYYGIALWIFHLEIFQLNKLICHYVKNVILWLIL